MIRNGALTLLLMVIFLMLQASVSANANETETISSKNTLDTPLLQDNLWQDIDEGLMLNRDFGRRIIPDQYRLVKADIDQLDQLMSQAPTEASHLKKSQLILPLPQPDGTIGKFIIEESPIMAPELAEKFPEIKTYRGFGLDDPTAFARLDRTPAGFHAFILSERGTVYIDPYRRGDTEHYLSYYKHQYRQNGVSTVFTDTVIPTQAEPVPARQEQIQNSSGPVLHTYRLALATTGEYTQFHGGTASQALAAIVTTINRVSGVFEREVSIRLSLINGNEKIIFSDPDNDPYTGINMLNTNQTIIDNIIGSENYDIGHLFTNGDGGIAFLGSVCNSSHKAKALTGLEIPEGDPFDIDFVAHEIGHQFGATHTFNARTAGSCNAGNFSFISAYEPGSGSTIMGYAGICTSQNIQTFSNDYFHTISFDQIRNFINFSGQACGTHIDTGNSAPVVDAGEDMTIEALSSFTLTGTATDIDGDILTYTWEQFDRGTGWIQSNVLPNTDIGTGPLFRSYTPKISPVRVFPNSDQPDLAALGEMLPSSDRTLTFRLIARDNKGGVSYDTMQVTVNTANLPKVYLPLILK